MKYINRREFLKKSALAGLAVTGSLLFPTSASSKRLSKEVIKKIFEPKLDPLTKKIIEIESNWRYWIKGDDNDIGLMQITPIVLKEWNIHGTGRLYGEYDLFDPYVNLEVGKWYLHERIGKHYLPHYDLKQTDENKAASYNAGPPTIGKIGDALENYDQLPKKTQKYLDKLKKLS